MDEICKLLNSVETNIFVVDKQLNVFFCNERSITNFIKNDSDYHGSIIDLFRDKDRTFVSTRFNKFITDNQTVLHLDLVLNDKNDKLVNTSICIRPAGEILADKYIITCKINYELNTETIENPDKDYKLLKAIFDNTSEAIFMASMSDEGIHGNFVKVNREACRRLGYTEEELLQRNARTINPDANMSIIKSFGETIKKEGRAIFEAIHEAKDGSKIPVEVSASIIEADNQRYVLSLVKDQREYKRLQKSEEMFGRLMNFSWEELFVFSSEDYHIVMANKGAMDNLGYKKKELETKKFTHLLAEDYVDEFEKLCEILLTGVKDRVTVESGFVRKDGSKYPVEIKLQISHSEVPPVYLANVQDITRRKKTQERLNKLANYDILTGLPNRALFLDRLSMAMKTSMRTNALIALLFIDLDGFKKVNDSYGHEAGDILLKEVAHRLTVTMRKSDTVSRLGGDEFTIILTNIKSIESLDVVLERIRQVIVKPIQIDDKEALVSPSIGVSVYPLNNNIKDSFEFIRQADMAMYQAKKSGKNTYKYFTTDFFAEETRVNELSEAAALALANQEFSVFYQPRICLDNGKINGAEALLRWNNSKLGFVSPLEFIPILEETGKIHDVGLWVLEESCKTIKSYEAQGLDIRISVNISIKQFEKLDFISNVKNVIEKYQIRNQLELEITEGLLLKYSEETIEMLSELKAAGISLSLDDFGTGYSSLSYLKLLPIDIIKIDKSFVQDMASSSDSMEIVKAIISLAKSLNRRITAEGIEKDVDVNILRELGCDEGQGFFYAKPMPREDLDEFIQRNLFPDDDYLACAK